MITGGQMDGIRKRIRALDAAVAARVDDVVTRTAGKGEAALRDAIFTELQPVCAEAFELSSQLAQAVYNGWRAIELGEAIETASVDVFDQEKFDNMAYAAVAKASKGEAASVIKSYAGFNIRDAYAQALFATAAKDKRKPRFARVPQGSETCRFCMMLASRGFEYSSGKSGQKVHNHANCDCIYVASWDKNPKAAGYDPDYYYDVYKHPEKHPEVNDAINARRRELYAEKKAESANQSSESRERVEDNPGFKRNSIGAKYIPGFAEYERYISSIGELTVNKNKQMQHILGSREFNERKAAGDIKSYFDNLDYDGVENLIRSNIGKGIPDLKPDGSWKNSEVVEFDYVVGYSYNIAKEKYDPVHGMSIRYRNDGFVHAVPKFLEGVDGAS